jgi:hypothetical protein
MGRRTGGVALVAIMMVIAGCGSSNDKGPSKADYIAKADAICKTGNDKIAAAVKAIPSSADAAAVQALATKTLIPNIEGQLKDLRALDKPKDDKDALNALYDSLQSAITKVKADPTLVTSTGGKTSPFADANAKANAYGMKVCGNG